MNRTNANDDVTARVLAAAQNDEFHTPTQTWQLILSEHTQKPWSATAMASISHFNL